MKFIGSFSLQNLTNLSVTRTASASTLVHCRISKLGSGSDFEAYFIRLGIAAGRARYTKDKVRNTALLGVYPENSPRHK